MSDTALNAAIEPSEFSLPVRATVSATPEVGPLAAPVETAGRTILLHLSYVLMPVAGLAIVLALPLVGFGAVLWLAGKALLRRG